MIGYVDCFSGVSGDMLLGALVDGGLPLATLERVASALAIDGEARVEAEPVMRGGVRATKVHVRSDGAVRHRSFADLREQLGAATGLSATVRERSLEVLGRLAAAEARVHGAAVDDVELHEVGAVDSMIDIVGTVAGLAELGITDLHASAVPLAPGVVAESAHGMLPAPGPATLELLASVGAPTRPFGEGRELVTPTGAALLATLATFRQPRMRLQRIGYGAGDAEFGWPNVLRLWLGTPVADGDVEARHVVIETNVDDMSPQLLAPIVERLLEAGALDVTVAPVLMKKGRPGSMISVIAWAESEMRLADILLAETTTLGVRVHHVLRHEAGRAIEPVATAYGPVLVKFKLLDGRRAGAMPEYESVREAAELFGVPLLDVHTAALAAASEQFERPRPEVSVGSR